MPQNSQSNLSFRLCFVICAYDKMTTKVKIHLPRDLLWSDEYDFNLPSDIEHSKNFRGKCYMRKLLVCMRHSSCVSNWINSIICVLKTVWRKMFRIRFTWSICLFENTLWQMGQLTRRGSLWARVICICRNDFNEWPKFGNSMKQEIYL